MGTEDVEKRERLACAAIRYKGEMFRGTIHADAFALLVRKYPKCDSDTPLKGFSEGFLTTTGRFVNKKAAREIAEREDQWKPIPGGLKSTDVEYSKK